MDLTGKVIKLTDVREFTSKKTGQKDGIYGFVLEQSGQYPKHVLFTVFGGERFEEMGIVVGGDYCVSFDIDAREWQGKWYNDVRAYKAVRIDATTGTNVAAATPVPSVAPPTAGNADSSDSSGSSANDLPF